MKQATRVEELLDEFESLLRDDKDFNYGKDEFNEWLSDMDIAVNDGEVVGTV